MCGTKDVCRRPAGGQVTINTVVRLGIWRGQLVSTSCYLVACRFPRSLTISESLARAGRRVGGASRWRSMASRTRTKRKPSGWSGDSSILDSSTVNRDIFSHRVGLLSQSNASATLPMVLSKRCLPVIHSIELTIAYFSLPVCELSVTSASFSSKDSVIALFPVDSVPWMTRFRHGAAFGCYLLASVARLISNAVKLTNNRVARALICKSRQGNK